MEAYVPRDPDEEVRKEAVWRAFFVVSGSGGPLLEVAAAFERWLAAGSDVSRRAWALDMARSSLSRPAANDPRNVLGLAAAIEEFLAGAAAASAPDVPPAPPGGTAPAPARSPGSPARSRSARAASTRLLPSSSSVGGVAASTVGEGPESPRRGSGPGALESDGR